MGKEEFKIFICGTCNKKFRVYKSEIIAMIKSFPDWIELDLQQLKEVKKQTEKFIKEIKLKGLEIVNQEDTPILNCLEHDDIGLWEMRYDY